METTPQQDYKLPEFPSYVKWVDRLMRRWWAIPLSVLLGSGILYKIDFGKETQQASAQQAPSRDTSEVALERIVKRVMNQYPYALEGYFLTAETHEKLRSLGETEEDITTEGSGLTNYDVSYARLLASASRFGDRDRFIDAAELQQGWQDIVSRIRKGRQESYRRLEEKRK